MERILESRKAFALNRYKTEKGFNTRGLERDTAALVIETGGFIHSFFLAVLPDGSVINPGINKTKDVESYYSDETLQTRDEKVAGLKIRQAVKDEPADTLVAWISPPGGEFDYKEGRFEIGRVRELLGIKILQCYGIPMKEVTPDYCESLFLMLEEFSDKSSQNINSPDDLRDKISIFNSADNSFWLDFLSHALPEMSEIFAKIKDGEVHHLKMKAIKDAKEEIKKEFEDVEISKKNLISTGARIEWGMQSRGWDLSGGGCGYLNSDLIGMQNVGFFGTTLFFGSEARPMFVKKCPYCDKEYNKILLPGFKCNCGQIFKGIC